MWLRGVKKKDIEEQEVPLEALKLLLAGRPSLVKLVSIEGKKTELLRGGIVILLGKSLAWSAGERVLPEEHCTHPVT